MHSDRAITARGPNGPGVKPSARRHVTGFGIATFTSRNFRNLCKLGGLAMKGFRIALNTVPAVALIAEGFYMYSSVKTS